MRYEIASAKQERPNRALVTVIEKTDTGVATGGQWTLPFDIQKKDFAELKSRFKAIILADTKKNTNKLALIAEMKNAGLETM